MLNLLDDKKYFKKIFKDKRGLIADVIYNTKINHIAYITTKKIVLEEIIIIKELFNILLF